MMEVGFWELILLGAIVLLVAGPERLPTIARTVGHWAGRAKAMSRSIKSQFEQELHQMDVRQQQQASSTRSRTDDQPTDAPEADNTDHEQQDKPGQH